MSAGRCSAGGTRRRVGATKAWEHMNATSKRKGTETRGTGPTGESQSESKSATRARSSNETETTEGELKSSARRNSRSVLPCKEKTDKAHHITRISKVVDLTQVDTLRDLASKECEGHDMLFSWTLVSHIVVLVPGLWKEAPGSTCRDALHCSAGLAERCCRASTCSITTGSERTRCTSATVMSLGSCHLLE